MGVIKHLKSIFPLPNAWKDDEKAFGLRLNDMFRDIQSELAIKNTPRFMKVVCPEGDTEIKFAYGTRAEITFIGASSTRLGKAIVYCGTNGGMQARTDLGSNLSIVTANGKITVTSTGGGTVANIWAYEGNVV